MILLVNDANILIDMLKLDLLESFFKLPYEFHVTDLVAVEVHEVNRDQLEICIDQGLLLKKGFKIRCGRKTITMLRPCGLLKKTMGQAMAGQITAMVTLIQDHGNF